MNKILSILIAILLPMIGMSQTSTDLPQYFIEGGDTIGIIISIEQAQSLDNDSELLELFKKMRIDCDSLDTHYVKVINALGEKVALLEIQNNDLVNQGKEKDLLINNLRTSLDNCEEDVLLCEEQLKNKDEEIKILKNEIFRQKVKKIISVAGNAALAILTTIIIIKS
jgi:hypothetical protein